jgi:hypothetical protein
VDSICLHSFKYNIFCVGKSTEGTSGLYAAHTGISPQGHFITNAQCVVFRRLRKIAKGDFTFGMPLSQSFSLSAWKNSAPNKQIFMKFDN